MSHGFEPAPLGVSLARIADALEEIARKLPEPPPAPKTEPVCGECIHFPCPGLLPRGLARDAAPGLKTLASKIAPGCFRLASPVEAKCGACGSTYMLVGGRFPWHHTPTGSMCPWSTATPAEAAAVTK